jgi:hypothetical protein
MEENGKPAETLMHVVELISRALQNRRVFGVSAGT